MSKEEDFRGKSSSSTSFITFFINVKPIVYIIGIVFLLFFSCNKKEEEKPEPVQLQLISVCVGSDELQMDEQNTGMAIDRPVVIRFSQILDTSTIAENFILYDQEEDVVEINLSYLDGFRTVSGTPQEELLLNSNYTVYLGSGLKGKKGEVFTDLEFTFTTLNPPLIVTEIKIDREVVDQGARIQDIDFTPLFEVTFSDSVPIDDLQLYSSVTRGGTPYDINIEKVTDSIFTFEVLESLPYYRNIKFNILPALGDGIEKEFEGLQLGFYTTLDTTYKFPEITDEELLTLVQEQTFKYFWDFAHPVSGLNRERNTSDQNVTSGGSGFGVMAILVGIERGFITRQEGIDQLEKIVHFLGMKADRFHGAWSHWLNGTTGEVNPFSSNDDGGDLVETSYMAMGLITARQYLDPGNTQESALIDSINSLYETIEWDWYTQGENSLTWHWSPTYEFEKNHKIRGWNECLITYIMAAASPTHGITKEVYEQGWGAGSNMINGNTFYGIVLPLGRDYGGPLFFEQYTFLGVDPRNLSDQYADYWEQAVNHTLINRQHCIVNPYSYVGYNEHCWGLTASDGNQGYSAHSPTNDRGVITPTAALSSIPFTPEKSMEAMRHFYYMLGDRLWGPYGFYDAFNVTAEWYASSNIAIDQGPIIVMIENYRTQLLWNLFMSAPEIQDGLTLLGFTYE